MPLNLSAPDQNSNTLFLRDESSKIFEDFLTMTLFTNRGRHPGQGPRDPAFPVPEIWDSGPGHNRGLLPTPV